tara:strand:+ start:235549 stop:235788 length:240 start_codon:yes stop_codon:yes gene_type:complete
MDSNSSDDLKGQQHKLLARILFFMGVQFLGAGFLAMLAPDFIAEMLSMDSQTVRMIGGALIVTGFMDFVIGQYFKRKSE